MRYLHFETKQKLLDILNEYGPDLSLEQLDEIADRAYKRNTSPRRTMMIAKLVSRGVTINDAFNIID